MRSFGFLLIILGAGSFILQSMDMEFKLIQLLDRWGESTGNIIRIGLAVVGALLVFLSFRNAKQEEGNKQEEAGQ